MRFTLPLTLPLLFYIPFLLSFLSPTFFTNTMLLRIPFFSLTIFLLASSQGMAEDPVAQAFMPPPTTQDPVYDVVARIGEDYLRLGSLTTTPGVQTLEHLPKLSELSQERPHAILQLVPAGWTQPEPTGGSVLVVSKG